LAHKELNVKGLSVTMPLKETVMSFLDSIIQAQKNRCREHGRFKKTVIFVGYNTDAEGALDAIEIKRAVKKRKSLSRSWRGCQSDCV